MSIDYQQLAQLARQAAADCIAQARREQRSNDVHLVNTRVTARDDAGDRIGSNLAYPVAHSITGEGLAVIARFSAPAQYAYLAIEGEAIDSAGDVVAYWGVDTRELAGPGERVPLEDQRPGTGPSVSQRIDATTQRRRARA